MSIRDHLRLGSWMNPTWDSELATDRVAGLGLDPSQKAGRLSGGQRAQLALTMAVAKRPELLVLDEPIASLDPLARREFLQDLMQVVVEQTATVIFSSHLVSDLERVCDYLIVLVGSRVRVAGEIEELAATHYRLTGPRRDRGRLPGDQQVIVENHTDRQSTFVVRTSAPVLDPAWTVERMGLEDMVLAYMTRAAEDARRPKLADTA
jgi:ABC-2 type transport system ATP-binding protein